MPQHSRREEIAAGMEALYREYRSPMFRVARCVLRVEQGRMQAELTLKGDSYGRLFPGTAAAAAAAPAEAWILPEERDAGETAFLLPVDALNKPADCAAWSVGRETWYDRVLTFRRGNA